MKTRRFFDREPSICMPTRKSFCDLDVWPHGPGPWKSFRQWSLTWRIFVPSFIEIPPL